ncbi:TPA: hypothetical protein L3N15_004206 [Vibrio parahaemolyticus]|nr:hypothetical protein [Vibrio parahaemolyticus]
MTEIDYLLTIDADGIVTYDDEDAVMAQVAEWADTPVGTLWGMPLWGNPIQKYKHLPVDNDTAGIIESSLAMKLVSDLPNISLKGIRVSPVSVDAYQIQIAVPKVSELLTLTKKVVS